MYIFLYFFYFSFNTAIWALICRMSYTFQRHPFGGTKLIGGRGCNYMYTKYVFQTYNFFLFSHACSYMWTYCLWGKIDFFGHMGRNKAPSDCHCKIKQLLMGKIVLFSFKLWTLFFFFTMQSATCWYNAYYTPHSKALYHVNSKLTGNLLGHD